MTYLLDTNTCIKYLNGTSEKIRNNLGSKQPEEINVCSVVKGELFYGALKSAKPEKNLDKVHKFLDSFQSLPFDDTAAEKYGEIRVKLEKTGAPIGPNDLFIAAITASNNKTLVTNNTREFRRVEGIKLEDWEE
ncbi:MAG: type II toxin-antitoxin system tRNA(fMet)-specific endonuclease VapC [Candidatus Scalindua sp.]